MPKELFGIPEIYEYEKTCTDKKILIIIKLLRESRNKNAAWCECVNTLEKRNSILEEEKSKLQDKLYNLLEHKWSSN